MTSKEYIESGAIEACIHGLADEAEQRQLQEMAARYPEVREARERVEAEMEAWHRSQAVAPDPARRQRVLDALLSASPETQAATSESPVSDEPKAPARVLPIAPAPRPVRWLRGMVAASVILLMGSILLNFYFWSQYTEARREYNDLVSRQNTLLARNEVLEAGFNMMRSPGMKQVVMDALPGKGDAKATVFWNPGSRDVYLFIQNLPEPPQGRQYQLWAIADGRPVPAGMVGKAEGMLHKMESVGRADAFAVSLEPAGGSATPTADAIYVLGKAS